MKIQFQHDPPRIEPLVFNAAHISAIDLIERKTAAGIPYFELLIYVGSRDPWQVPFTISNAYQREMWLAYLDREAV